MKKPPITLSYPTFVVEFAIVDSTVKFNDRKTLNVGGEWLGKVPKLAICKDIESSEYHLSHCSDDWDDLCSVQTGKSIEDVKNIAERHYQGINTKWIKTNYNQADAIAIFKEEEDRWRCSFCGKSHYDLNTGSIISGENAKICSECIEQFAKDIKNVILE